MSNTLTPKKRRINEDNDAVASIITAVFSNEGILLHTLAYNDKRGVIAAAGTCRELRGFINGSATLWRSLVDVHYPALTGRAMSSEIFCRAEKYAALIGDGLHRGLDTWAEQLGISKELVGNGAEGRNPYESPTTGTTANSTPDMNGRFPEPVYYDWDANWDRVADLVPTQPVQAALRHSVEEASDGYYFFDWDENKIWPFLFNNWRRYGNGEQDAIMLKFLPRGFVREMNSRVADWARAQGEIMISSDEYNPKKMAGSWVRSELENNDISDNIDECVEKDLVHCMTESLHEKIYEDARDLLDEINDSAEALLYRRDGPLRATLLCTTPNSYAFMPLNYTLAKLLSPNDAELKVYASSRYSVVVDERRNIVFDNFWYFVGESASRALAMSRDCSQLEPSEFDYSLGGIVES